MPNEEISNAKLLELITQTIDSRFEQLSNKIDHNNKILADRLQLANSTIDKLQEENLALKERIDILERNIRKKNIAVYGINVDEDGNNLLSNSISTLNDIFGKHFLKPGDIANIYHPKKENISTPIIIEFLTYSKKEDIFKNLHRLKDTGVTIYNDLSKVDRKINKVLKNKLKEARKKNIDAKIKGKSIVVAGKEYTYENLIAQEATKVNHLERNSSNDDDLHPDEGDVIIHEGAEAFVNQIRTRRNVKITKK